MPKSNLPPDEHRQDEPPDNAANVTAIPPGASPSRQLRRVGVKIGQKVLTFERPVFRLGPLHIYRTATGHLSVRWIRRSR